LRPVKVAKWFLSTILFRHKLCNSGSMKHFSSLRLRMIAAFLLVAVPPMLFSAYFAARLLSDAFDRNVQQWLTETANFISTEVDELITDAGHASNVLADKLKQAPSSDSVLDRSDVALLSSLGVDIVAIYDENNRLLYSSIPLDEVTPLPERSTKSLFDVTSNGISRLTAGAISTFTAGGKLRRIFVGYWLNDTINAAANAITSLEFEVFRNEGGRLVPMLPKEKQSLHIPPSAEVIALLKTTDASIPASGTNHSIYRAVYSGLKASNGQLLGVAFVGFATPQSLFDQIGRWHLFIEMALVGGALSVLVGLWMSGLLVKPLRALTNGVRSVAKGDFKQRVQVGGGAEVEELAVSFNAMAAELDRLRSMEAELRNREKLSALGEAAAMIAHEVRNPLGIIKTSSELIRARASLTREEERVMSYVTDEVNRIERLIRDFLEFAKPTPPIFKPVNLKDVIERISKVVGPEFKRRNIVFSIEGDSAGSRVEGDPDQIYQVCLNLILNSMDALGDGGRITANIRKMNAGVVLRITDNGPGIDSAVAARIFNPFFTTKATGTGLGLAKAQSIMTAHGGSLIFSAAAGGGAHFDMIFPERTGQAA
jgi:signal transduction histidine kinase